MIKYQSYVPKEECVNRPIGWNEMAMAGHSFDFLFDERENIYKMEDYANGRSN